jgi:hypothetical protein
VSGTAPDDPEIARLLADADGLRQRYCAASADEPPAALDDAIRAAARREVGARPRSPGSPFGASWRVPLSIAAVVVVSATVTLMVAERGRHVPVAGEAASRVSAPARDADARERQMPSVPETTGPRAGANAAKSTGSADKPESADRDEQRRQLPELKDAAPRAKREEQVPLPAQLKPAAPPTAEGGQGAPELYSSQPGAPPAPFEQAAPPVGEPVEPEVAAAPGEADAGSAVRADSVGGAGAAAANRLREESGRGATASPESAARSAPRALAKEKAASAARKAAPSAETSATAESRAAAPAGPREPWESDPQAWLKHIEELMRAARYDEAKTSFKAFRERYPDYALPPGFAPPGP